MSTLTKTEEKILVAMENDPRGQHAECWTHGFGPGGGSLNYGSRGFKACKSLVKKGLAEEVAVDRGVRYTNGYGEHDSEIVIRLVD